jgi:predicted Zn finger-like uncharacterized protein
MIVQCPRCQTKYSLDESRFGGATSIRGRCKQCQAQFSVDLSAPASPAAAPPPAPTANPNIEGTRISKAGASLRLPHGKIVSLSVTEGPLKGQIFRLTTPRVVLGRSGTDIVIADPEVSRRHCAIEVQGSQATLIDLGTTNGTIVDGKQIARHELEHLSEFRIGMSTILFTITDQASAHA